MSTITDAPHIAIVETLPPGYRWATEAECEAWPTLAARMVQVRVNPADPDETDLAIRRTVTATPATVRVQPRPDLRVVHTEPLTQTLLEAILISNVHHHHR